MRASDMGPRWVGGSVKATLVLEGAPGEKRLLLDHAGSSHGDRVKRMRSAELRFAGDGHALALSRDKGATWVYVALDAGDEPFFCSHASCSGPDPWSGAPTTRALVLEILASSMQEGATKGRNHATRDEQPPSSLQQEAIPEFRAAVGYAGAHLADAELRLALARAMLLPGEQLGHANVANQALAAVVSAAKEHADVRELMQKAEPDEYGRLLEALGRIADPAAQDRLAKLVSTEQQAAPSEKGDAKLRDALHALVAATLRCRAGSDEVLRVLISAAKDPRSMPSELRYDYEKETAISGRYTERRLGVYGLAGLGTPPAKAALEEVAKEPCRSGRTSQGRAVDDPWGSAKPQWTGKLESLYDELQRDDRIYFTTGCWAQAALAAPAAPTVAPPK